MIEAVIDNHQQTVDDLVDLSSALLVIALAKRAPNRNDWFPHGKVATILSMEVVVMEALRGVFK